MKPTLATAAIAAVLFSGTALAQQSYVEIDDDVQVPSLSVKADDLDDLDVSNTSGEKIGEVEEVVGTDRESPTAVSVEFDDDVADDDRIVALSDLTMNGDQLVIELGNDAIAQLPTYDD